MTTQSRREDEHMTLTEFLLARIAEDEAEQVEDNLHGPRGWHSWQECDAVRSEGYRDCDCGIPARVLAECEAKRRIVAYAMGMGDVSGDGLEILALMCLPYIDHPDCLHEWWQ